MREAEGRSYRVFISHSSANTWVAEQIRAGVCACGAEAFLDRADIMHGDEFDEKILEAAEACQELLVLLTPSSFHRPYVWMEISLFWQAIWRGADKRIVPVFHELDHNFEAIPAVLKKFDWITLNDMPSYFAQLTRRVKDRGGSCD